MKGFVPTPDHLVDTMVEKLFRDVSVSSRTRVLDPGCGEGPFIEGILRWCSKNRTPVPRILGIEQHEGRAASARRRFAKHSEIEILTADYLVPLARQFDLIIGNPPYVSIGNLTPAERADYRSRFQTARGRFDLYMLFFEQALNQLAPEGRLVFVTPEKYTYVDSGEALRCLLRSRAVHELHYIDEASFEGLVTYPVVTTIGPQRDGLQTTVIHRSGDSHTTSLTTASSWQSRIQAHEFEASGPTLADVALRISCGIATGADAAFVIRDAEVTHELRPFAYPTVSGRQLGRQDVIATRSLMLIPYDRNGALIDEDELGPLGRFLAEPMRSSKLRARTCTSRKPWYAFHDSAPMSDILRPKLICKDISAAPFFAADRTGAIVPRHSTYYVVPRNARQLSALQEYLNSNEAVAWLMANCQRAANGFVRLQSGVLKRMPVPSSFVESRVAARNEEPLELIAAG
jgi:hypothetical protein